MYKNKLEEVAGKTTFNFISVAKLSQFLIPLPPLAEQRRMVSKIEELMKQVEGLKKS
jgi:type I restriction enzyme S subunit